MVGAPYDMEVHLVHRDSQRNPLIIAVFFEQQSANKALTKLWSVIPEVGEKAPEPVALNPESLLPPRRKYLHYEGSLTHPPCTEGVKWFVLTDSVPVSGKQVDEFTSKVPFNARPLQPLNGRKVTKSTRG